MIERLREEQNEGLILTPYQLSQLVLFPGFVKGDDGRYHREPFAGLGGALTSEEKQTLWVFSRALAEQESGLAADQADFSMLSQLAWQHQCPAAGQIFNRLGRLASLTVIGQKDLKSWSAFAKLPLLSQYALSLAGKGLFDQIQAFVSQGGLISFVQFNKPAPDYLKAVDDLPALTTLEKVALALSFNGSNHVPESIKTASHQFLTLAFIPPQPETYQTEKADNPFHLSLILNRRLDEKIEPSYARLTLLREILNQESKGALLAMVGVAAVLPFLHWLNQQGQDSLLLQAIVKFIPPFAADLVTFWVQLQPWLEGENLGEKLTDFGRRLTSSHRQSFLASLTATALGSSTAEAIGQFNQNIGAFIYSAIPLIVAYLTTFDTVRSLKIEETDFWQRLQIVFKNNPAQLSIDVAATLTFLTGAVVLGPLDQFHNPTAIALIEGGQEHALAALLTLFQLHFGLTREFEQQLKAQIQKKAAGFFQEEL